MERFYYCKHGLLFIVYENEQQGMFNTAKEDSRWEDEDKAKEHCRILNNKIYTEQEPIIEFKTFS